MIKYLILTFLVVFFSFTSFAQRFSMEEWHDGRVILSEGDTIKGSINYDLKNNMIQLVPAGTKEAYALSAQSILYFDLIDKLTENYRQFVVLRYDINNNNYNVPVIFELLVEGELTLLAREKIELRTVNHPMYRAYSTRVIVYDYFFLQKNQKISLFSQKKRDLGQYVKPFEKQITEYIKDNNFQVDRMGDLARIVVYYNSLKLNRR